jgi:tRNA threonylcarbamoyladenosine biosynthesis protein TsaB
VIPISTLAALSLEAMDAEGVELSYACIDARMNEVYWGVYEREGKGGVRLVGCESVMPPTDVIGLQGRPGVGVGSGWATYPEALADQLGSGLRIILPDRFPKAAFIAKLGAVSLKHGGGLPAEQALPVYLRDNVARKPDKRP